MSNVAIMWKFFDIIQHIIEDMAEGDVEKKQLLKEFMVALLTVCDGLHDPLNWDGIALVAKKDLPDDVEEINDGFLHDMWSDNYCP